MPVFTLHKPLTNAVVAEGPTVEAIANDPNFAGVRGLHYVHDGTSVVSTPRVVDGCLEDGPIFPSLRDRAEAGKEARLAYGLGEDE